MDSQTHELIHSEETPQEDTVCATSDPPVEETPPPSDRPLSARIRPFLKKGLNSTPAYFLGLFGIGTGLLAVLAELVSFVACFILMGAHLLVEREQIITWIALIQMVTLLFLAASLITFAMSLGLSTASLLVSISQGIRREKRKHIQVILNIIALALLILACLSLTSRGLFTLGQMLTSWSLMTVDTLFLIPLLSTFATLTNLVFAVIMSVLGLVAVILSRKYWFNYIIAIIGLLIGPLLAFFNAVLQTLLLIALIVIFTTLVTVAVLLLVLFVLHMAL